MAVGVLQSPTSTPARDRSELILAQLDRLPTISGSIARLLAVTGDEQSSSRDLIEVIEPDPSLTASVLRMVRRADLGATREGMTVSKAVRLLGFTAVRNAAIAHQFFDVLSNPQADAAANARRNELWRHGIMAACAAESLASTMRNGPTAGEAFVAGLLHDIGKIALDACFPKSFARVMERGQQEKLCACDLENEVFGLDHTVAGRRLAVRWDLPPSIVEAIWLHHQQPDHLPSSTVNAALVQLVHLADGMVRSDALGFSGSRHPFDADATCRMVGIAREAARQITESLPQRAAPLCEAIGLDSVETLGARIETLSRANAELSRLNARLSEENRGLSTRGAAHAALAGLLGLSQADGPLGHTCAVVAKALCDSTGCESAVVLTLDVGGAHVHVGACSAGSTHAEIVENAARFGFDTPCPPGTWGSVNSELLELFERCTGDADITALRVLTLGSESIAMLRVGPRQVATEDLAALVRAISATIDAARSRRSAERMTQELLDLNRRLAGAQVELARQRSLSMIASVAGGAAHELNNPLTVISGRAQLEQARCQDDELRKVWQTVFEQAHRASDIVSELMDFAKPRPPVPGSVLLVDAVQSACQHCGKRFAVDPAQFRLDFADAQAAAFCDPQQLALVLEEILTNALQATDGIAKSVEVNSRSTASDETVRLRVKDDGVGMVPEVLEHALDPFFSHRPAGRGRGLGLSRAYRLAEINGGRLWIESSPQLGTTVTIELPARA
jgi:putative nucleotidyltransferase with HDIG domain